MSRLTRALTAGATLAGRAVRSLPGLLSAGFGITGSAILWGTGWAFLTASAFAAVLAVEVN
jgi:hypothetical protein